MDLTLVIMAAGMGSRYGGLKQIDPVGNYGEFILDYSIYDAIKAGFNKVIFIIKEENLEVFRETVGRRIEKQIEVEYAFQEINTLPEGFTAPANRTKPWGTAHAVLACKDLITSNFAVINADDFYGRESFAMLAEFLQKTSSQKNNYHFCMAGYILKNTVTDYGHVARGVCEIDENHYLTGVTERTKIQINGDVIQYFEEDSDWTTLLDDTIVSMNCWGFTPQIFPEIEAQMIEFFQNNQCKLDKVEFFLPSVVQSLLDQKKCDVAVLPTTAKWYGVTYHEDKAAIVSYIQELIQQQTYPERLW